MFECTGALVKWCKGHVNESSRHANSICSLSEEHQSLAGIKMRLLKLQQSFLVAQLASAPEKPWPPTWMSTNCALCFKAMEITKEKREDRNSYIMQPCEGQRETFPYLCGIEGIYTHHTSFLCDIHGGPISATWQIFWNKIQVHLFSQLSLFKQYSTGFPKGHTLTCELHHCTGSQTNS